jgi:hypothetical protein
MFQEVQESFKTQIVISKHQIHHQTIKSQHLKKWKKKM